MTGYFQKKLQRFRDLTLQSKITIALLLSVTVPILMLGIFFYGRFYDMTVSYAIRQEQDASAKTAPMIEDIVQEVLDSYQTLSDLPFFKSLFQMPVSGSFSELLDSPSAGDFRRQVDSMVDGKLITDIRIFMDFPELSPEAYSRRNTEGIFYPLSYARPTYWYGIFQGTANLYELFCPAFYLGINEQQASGDLAYIKSTTFYYQGTAYPSYIAVYYSSQPIKKILADNLSLEGSVSYIINDRDALVSSSDPSLSGIYWLDYKSIHDSLLSSNNFIQKTILDEKIYAGFYSISQPKWFMVTVLPSKPLVRQGQRMMYQFMIFYFLFLLLAFLMANSLAHSITNRLSSVIVQMREVRYGPPVPMASPVAHDEVGDLIDTYNYMARQMNHLIEEQAKSAEELRIAEFNSLQAQINPHFLYNTMDMINWLAKQGRTDEIRDAIQNLSRFYKLTLSRKKSISTIEHEEEHVSIYIRLQNMRFHDSIDFVSDIPDELMKYQIPKLTLQPVIENAILHGILEKEDKSGTIVLTGWKEEGDIVLLISDDGVGIPPEKLPSILSGQGKSASGGTNIAVSNTHRRLQILYGEAYGLTYSSELGKGTEVQIRIPANLSPEKTE